MSAHQNRILCKEVSIDYITATSACGPTTRNLCAFAKWLVSQEVQEGCRARPWSNTGYRGTVAGSIAYGVSQQGGIVRASNQVSREHWGQLLSLADNVTRLDLQVTLRPLAGTTATLRRHHRELLKAPRQRGKPIKFKVYYGPDGPEGIHIGRRVSDRFGRVYDKGLESGLPEYQGYLRYEVELHRKVAYGMAQFLDSQELDQRAMLHYVHTFFTVRGLSTSGTWHIPMDPAVFLHGAQDCELPPAVNRSRPEVVKALRWLHNSVRPCVERLTALGLAEEVQRALGVHSEIRMAHQFPDVLEKESVH